MSIFEPRLTASYLASLPPSADRNNLKARWLNSCRQDFVSWPCGSDSLGLSRQSCNWLCKAPVSKPSLVSSVSPPGIPKARLRSAASATIERHIFSILTQYPQSRWIAWSICTRVAVINLFFSCRKRRVVEFARDKHSLTFVKTTRTEPGLLLDKCIHRRVTIFGWPFRWMIAPSGGERRDPRIM